MGPFLKSSCLPLWFLVHMLQIRSHFIKDHWWQVAQRQLPLAGSGLGWDWKWSVKLCNIWLSSFFFFFFFFLLLPQTAVPLLPFIFSLWDGFSPGESENKRGRGGEPNAAIPRWACRKCLWPQSGRGWFWPSACARACVFVCVFVLPWSTSGLGGGFSSGCLCICAVQHLYFVERLMWR